MTGKFVIPTLLLATLSLGLLAAPGATRAADGQGSHAASRPQASPARETRARSRSANRASHKHGRALTLEQAVARVQNRTGGKVLKADSRDSGRYTEYRIKVLTPEGHVRVVTLRSDGRGN